MLSVTGRARPTPSAGCTLRPGGHRLPVAEQLPLCGRKPVQGAQAAGMKRNNPCSTCSESGKDGINNNDTGNFSGSANDNVGGTDGGNGTDN